MEFLHIEGREGGQQDDALNGAAAACDNGDGHTPWGAQGARRGRARGAQGARRVRRCAQIHVAMIQGTKSLKAHLLHR